MSDNNIKCPGCGEAIDLTPISERNALELRDLKEALAVKAASVKVLQEREWEFRKQQRELEERRAMLDLDIARKMDEERAQIRRAAEQHSLKDREKDRLIDTLKQSLDDAKRKVDQEG
jgi:hypothetical protein